MIFIIFFRQIKKQQWGPQQLNCDENDDDGKDKNDDCDKDNNDDDHEEKDDDVVEKRQQ